MESIKEAILSFLASVSMPDTGKSIPPPPPLITSPLAIINWPLWILSESSTPLWCRCCWLLWLVLFGLAKVSPLSSPPLRDAPPSLLAVSSWWAFIWRPLLCCGVVFKSTRAELLSSGCCCCCCWKASALLPVSTRMGLLNEEMIREASEGGRGGRGGGCSAWRVGEDLLEDDVVLLLLLLLLLLFRLS